MKIDITHATKDNGTVFVNDYKLKRTGYLFTEDNAWELGMPKQREYISKIGDKVLLIIGKTMTGNYAQFKIRKEGVLYRYDCAPFEVFILIDSVYNNYVK